jgi:hypothetical protein
MPKAGSSYSYLPGMQKVYKTKMPRLIHQGENPEPSVATEA